MERLSAEDRLMLWPDERWPQEIGALAVLDGAGLIDTDGRLQLAPVRQAVESRLHLVPRFRQVLCVPPRVLGGPLWVDAPAFDLSDHIRVARVPAPGDEAALLGAAEQVLARRLERSRPLWEMCFLTGLPDRRIGLVARLHHAVADGIAGVAGLGALLDPPPGLQPVPSPPWFPSDPPTARVLAADALRGRAAGARRGMAGLARPAAAACGARAAAAGLRSMVSTPPTPRTSLDQVVGPGRRLAIVRGEIEGARLAAHRHGATINDVLLAVTAAGVRALLRSRGEDVEDLTLPVYMPVTLRPAEHRELARGNMIGQTVVALPVGEPDSRRRLELIAAATAQQKAGSHSDLGAMFRGRIARRMLLAVLARHPVSVTTADVPGPPRPVHLAGARLVEAFPVLPLIGNVTIGVGALSYAGQLNITVVADRDAVPDLATFAEAASREMTELCGPGSPDGARYLAAGSAPGRPG